MYGQVQMQYAQADVFVKKYAVTTVFEAKKI